jgi:hypothetical protein
MNNLITTYRHNSTNAARLTRGERVGTYRSVWRCRLQNGEHMFGYRRDRKEKPQTHVGVGQKSYPI